MKKLLLALIPFFLLASSAAAMDGGEPSKQSQGLRLQELSGEEVDLGARITQGGRPTLLFFWTSWCPFCMKELRTIGSRVEELGNCAEVFAINAGEDMNVVRRVQNSYGLRMSMLIDDRMKAVETFGIVGVPTFILIDKQGGIVFKDNAFPEDELREACK